MHVILEYDTPHTVADSRLKVKKCNTRVSTEVRTLAGMTLIIIIIGIENVCIAHVSFRRKCAVMSAVSGGKQVRLQVCPERIQWAGSSARCRWSTQRPWKCDSRRASAVYESRLLVRAARWLSADTSTSRGAASRHAHLNTGTLSRDGTRRQAGSLHAEFAR